MRFRGGVSALILSISIFSCSSSGDGRQFFRKNVLRNLVVANVKVGRDTFADVQKTLGVAQLRQKGDAGDYVAAICYTSGMQTLTFFSGSLGAGRVVTNFKLTTLQDSDCREVDADLKHFRTKSGLHLGMPRRAVELILGPPTQSDGPTMTYVVERNTSGMDTSVILELHFTSDRLLAIEGAYLQSK